MSGNAAADRAAVIARFAIQVQRSGAGTVLAGRTGSADNFGPLAVVRADGATTSVLSTVDDVDNAAGQVVTVLALRDAAAGKAGSYGTAGNAQAPAPTAQTG
ncbi:secreted protein [Kutzneria sp. 744]|nr:secreted protein [Kutzneria sp. 744]